MFKKEDTLLLYFAIPSIYIVYPFPRKRQSGIHQNGKKCKDKKRYMIDQYETNYNILNSKLNL